MAGKPRSSHGGAHSSSPLSCTRVVCSLAAMSLVPLTLLFTLFVPLLISTRLDKAVAAAAAATTGAVANNKTGHLRTASGASRPRDGSGLDSAYSVVDAAALAELVDGDHASVVAYFAPWCGHCQTFIPKFVRFADHASLYSDSSALRERAAGVGGRQEGRFDVVFGTVNCVSQRALCDAKKIEFYPTLLVRRVPGDASTVKGHGKVMHGDLDELERYLKKRVAVRSANGVTVAPDNATWAADSVPGDGGDGLAGRPALQRWVAMAEHGLARHTSLLAPVAPALRLADGLMSLNYLLAVETFRRPPTDTDTDATTTTSTITTSTTSTTTSTSASASTPLAPLALDAHALTAAVAVVDLVTALLPLPRPAAPGSSPPTALRAGRDQALRGLHEAYTALRDALRALSPHAHRAVADVTQRSRDAARPPVPFLSVAAFGALLRHWWTAIWPFSRGGDGGTSGGRLTVAGPARVRVLGAVDAAVERVKAFANAAIADGQAAAAADAATGAVTGAEVAGWRREVWAGLAPENATAAAGYTWRVCGVLGPSARPAATSNHTAAARTDKNDTTATTSIRRRRRAALASLDSHSSALPPQGVTLPGRAGAETGYTCGLWALLHYLTVAAAEQPPSPAPGPGVAPGTAAAPPAPRPWDTTAVMAVMRAVVASLFGCGQCRAHFLAAYDGCAHGRCDVGPTDYAALQLWLFRLHNAVTLNAFHTRRDDSAGGGRGGGSTRWGTGQGQGQGQLRVQALQSKAAALLFPAEADCPACRTPTDESDKPHRTGADAGAGGSPRQHASVGAAVVTLVTDGWDRAAVLRYLRAAYWQQAPPAGWAGATDGAAAAATAVAAAHGGL